MPHTSKLGRITSPSRSGPGEERISERQEAREGPAADLAKGMSKRRHCITAGLALHVGKEQEGWSRSPSPLPFSVPAARPPSPSARGRQRKPIISALSLKRAALLVLGELVLAYRGPGAAPTCLGCASHRSLLLTFKRRSKNVEGISSGEVLPCSANASGLDNEERTVSELGLSWISGPSWLKHL